MNCASISVPERQQWLRSGSCWARAGIARHFFQTHDGQAWQTDIPFDLVADFVPEVLRDPDINRLRYDEVTRTYLFPLDAEMEQLPAEPELRAYFLSADGQALRTLPLRLRTDIEIPDTAP